MLEHIFLCFIDNKFHYHTSSDPVTLYQQTLCSQMEILGVDPAGTAFGHTF